MRAIVPHLGMTIPSCSVVVCTRHRPALLARCLASLARLEHPSYEVIVVDNTSGEREVEEARRRRRRPLPGREPGRPQSRTEHRRPRRPRRDRGLHRRRRGGRAGLAEPTRCRSRGFGVSWRRRGGSCRFLSTPRRRECTRPPAEKTSARSPFASIVTAHGWFEMANFGGVGVGPNMAFRRALFEGGLGVSRIAWARRRNSRRGALRVLHAHPRRPRDRIPARRDRPP